MKPQAPSGLRLRAVHALVPILLAAFALRLALAGALPIESDEAIGGLMARHVLEGERPIFYYGQTYMGALEAYITAPVFAVAGASTFAFRFVPSALSLLFCALTFAIGRRVYSTAVGAVAAAYVGVSPLFLTIWSVKGRTHYVETLVLGSLLLLLLLDIAYDGRRESWRPVALGLLAGVAFWANFLILPYLVVVALALALRPGVPRPRVAALALPAFLVGSLPLWVANAASGFATFRGVAEANAGGLASLREAPANLVGFWRLSAPVLLGWAQPSSSLDLFAAERAAQPLAFRAGAAVAALLLLLALHRAIEMLAARRAVHGVTDPTVRLPPSPQKRQSAGGGSGRTHPSVVRVRSLWESALSQRDLPLLGLFALTPLLFAADKVAGLHFGEPRYALPLYSTVPLFAAYLWRLRRRSGLAFAAVLAVALGLNVWSNLAFDVRLALPVVRGRSLPAGNAELIRFLLERGDTRVYTDYWIAYPVAFESGERIVAGVLGDDLRRGFNRYIPHAIAVDAAPSPAYVFVAGSRQDEAFGGKLGSVSARYERTLVGGYAVYDAIDPPQHVAE